jgi:hypothetical protein
MNDTTAPEHSICSSLPRQSWIGLLLIAVCWPLNWLLPGLRTQFLFFPLWLGYILTVDGLVFLRKDTSLLTRSRLRFIGLFLASVPAWWLFELFNERLQNWHYLGREQFTDLQFFVLSTFCFSTVIPAIFGTAELMSTFVHRVRGPVIRPTPRTLAVFFGTGLVMLALLLIWPRYFFPFVWLSMFFILEPLNAALGFPTLAQSTQNGDWKPVVVLWLGALTCGFFWEMWNFFSFPKWVYTVPFVNFLHIFEMPLLGYGGYLPFGLEVYSLYNFVSGLVRSTHSDYVRLGE